MPKKKGMRTGYVKGGGKKGIVTPVGSMRKPTSGR